MLVIKSVLILCSAAIVLAAQSGTKAVVSGAIFIGEDTTDPSTSPLEIFQNPGNHATAVASILVYSAEHADFHPVTHSSKSLERTLNFFIQKATTFPGFVPERIEQTPLSLDGSFTQFEQLIREANPDYRHQALLARSLRDLIPGYIVDEDLDELVLSLVVLDKPDDSDTLKFGIVTVNLSINSTKTGTASIPKQQAKMATAFLTVNKGFLTSKAETLSGRMSISSIRDFLDYFASPKVEKEEYRTIATTPCHKKNDALVNQGQRALYN